MRILFRRRWLRWLVWNAISLIVLFMFAVFWWFANEQQRGISFDPPDQPIAWTNVPQGGVNLPSLQYESPETISRTLDLAQAAGFKWLRVQFPWEDLEIHGKNDWRDYRHDYNGDGVTNERDAISAWTKYDGIVSAAQARGMELIVRLDRPPAWARQNLPQDDFRVAQRNQDQGATGPPDNYADYGDYVDAVVSRYRGRIRFFQIWNEPNYGHEWNWADPDPAKFVELLKIGWTRAKAANPDVVIIFPSLTPADGLDWQAMSDLTFLERVYQLGGGAYFDILGAQQYGLGQPATENRYIRLVKNQQGQLRRDLLLQRPLDSRTDITRVVLLREIMETYGDSHKAVWIGEFGWNSSPMPTQFGAPVSEDQKAQYIVELMQRARREWNWLGVMNVWFLRSGANFAPEDVTRNFQLVREDWTPLPAYTAIQNYLTSPPVVGVGAYSADHEAWRETDAGYELRFWGDQVQFETTASTVMLDGAVQDASTIKTTLGEHTLVMPEKPPMVYVSRRNSSAWFWNLAPFGLLIVLIWTLHQGFKNIEHKA